MYRANNCSVTTETKLISNSKVRIMSLKNCHSKVFLCAMSWEAEYRNLLHNYIFQKHVTIG